MKLHCKNAALYLGLEKQVVFGDLTEGVQVRADFSGVIHFPGGLHQPGRTEAEGEKRNRALLTDVFFSTVFIRSATSGWAVFRFAALPLCRIASSARACKATPGS